MVPWAAIPITALELPRPQGFALSESSGGAAKNASRTHLASAHTSYKMRLPSMDFHFDEFLPGVALNLVFA
jgi:hypothetical protein